MDLNSLWKKAIGSSTLSDAEKETLYGIDPAALQESVSALQKQLDAAENAQLSETEKLQKELTKLRGEREALDKDLRALSRKNRIGEIARKFGCDEPDYLDFLTGKAALDLDDDNAVTTLVGELKKSHPSAFTSQLKSGGGADLVAAPVRGGEVMPGDAGSRLGVLMQTIGKVPFQE